ncbi:MAG TPA: terpene cyclase/mutase family protein [Candidatus Paceibacterota bacterium]|nr:terpene cyclase/mutase family protein [Verrucomicrobiota bacterium]HRZ45803.1 terpene cyclase/mutase family protein [Candidatus Paceibacterota bacterium]HRZ91695.1 terpene cyclase/mutase family protein [Candidatus Paceibacterota bacterium]
MRTTFSCACALGVAASMFAAAPLRAVTPEEIASSIDRGLAWLVSQQNLDGSWSAYYGSEPVAGTSLAVVKLEERAFEMGYPSPFDESYPYRENVIRGLNYLMSQTASYGAGMGVCFTLGSHETYRTGLGMMAIAASRAPDRVVNVSGSYVDGWTYQAVLQACVDYFVFAQNPDGGWRYFFMNEPSDNSNSGYAVLGLRYAEAPAYGFECAIPDSTKNRLSAWLNAIQDASGGSQYVVDGDWVNLLKTGNLLFEMSLVGDSTAVPRVQSAIVYIQNTWNDLSSDPGWRPHEYQCMYCLMKGFVSLGIDTITVAGNPVDWYQEFAAAIVASQNADGSWPPDRWGDSALATAWALMVLEKVAPPPPVEVQIDLPDCACDQAGYDVKTTYTVERFVVDGVLTIYEDSVLVDTLILSGFTGTAEHLYSVASDAPGIHLWAARLEVVPVGGGTPGRDADMDNLVVCETPQVGDIPDQIAPFQPIDLDSYLTYNGVLPVTWAAAGVPDGWTVTIDAGNVATVTPPEGANEPAGITFVASVTCCPEIVCSDGDMAIFTPNQPPDCSGAYPSIARLWPPNNTFTAIQVLGVTDPDGDPITITIDGIWQDEPVNTFGDGNFGPDASGVGSSTAQVRAERSGTQKVPGNGRMYHIRFTASDGRGMSCSGEVLVGVPHDFKAVVIDDGPNFDSTIVP